MKSRYSFCVPLLVGLGVVSTTPPCLADAYIPEYEVKIVGSTDHSIAAINNHGQAVGWYYIPHVAQRPVQGDTTGLDFLGAFQEGYATDINDQGTVVVQSYDGNPNGEVTLVPGFNLGTCANAYAVDGWGINDYGVVAGVCYFDDTNYPSYWDFTWHTLEQVGDLGIFIGVARDINNRSVIVGRSTDLDCPIVPAKWVDFKAIRLPSLDTCTCGYGLAIRVNEAGTIVGYSGYAGGIPSNNCNIPTAWDSTGTPTELPHNGLGKALDVNNCDWAVGYDEDGGVLWVPDDLFGYVKYLVQDLVDYTDPDDPLFALTVSQATAINDLGWIGCNTNKGVCILVPKYVDLADSVDTDGDGLWDQWEVCGVDGDDDGLVDLHLPLADPLHRDLYVELDANSAYCPPVQALSDIVAAFAAAPLDNPDGSTGINLHFTGEADPDDRSAFCDPCVDDSDVPGGHWSAGWTKFDAERLKHFGSEAERGHPRSADILAAKEKVFRYGMSIESFTSQDGATDSQGEARAVPSNHFILSMAGLPGIGGGAEGARAASFGGSVECGFSPIPISIEEWSGVLMHEIGHTLGLWHGGTVDVNYKPNYYSVMNYSWTCPVYAGDDLASNVIAQSAIQNWTNSWRLDFSHGGRNSLNESDLDESAGLGGEESGWAPAGYDSTSLVSRVHLVEMGGPAADWNVNGSTTDEHVVENLNFISPVSESSEIGVLTTLEDANDWELLQYLPTDAPFWYTNASARPMAFGAPATTEGFCGWSSTIRDALSNLRFDCNGNGVYDDEEILSGALPDVNGNGIPDGCESGDAPVAVAWLEFTADPGPSGIQLTWSTEDAAGSSFFVYRESAGGSRERIADEPLTGEGTLRYLDSAYPAGELRYWLLERDRTGLETWHGPWSVFAARGMDGIVPALSYPNPFRAGSQIRYGVREEGFVRLAVYDLSGRLVSVLVEEVQVPGDYEVSWPGHGGDGQSPAAGIYFLRLDAGGATKLGKLLIRR